MATNSSRSDAFPDFSQSNTRRILIVDPRQLKDNLLISDTKSRVVRVFIILKELSEKWFSHILLLAFLIFYACIGAWIFEYVEGSYESDQNAIIRGLRDPVHNLTDELVKQLWDDRRKNYPMPRGDGFVLDPDPLWETSVARILRRFEIQVRKSCKEGLEKGISSDTEITKWTFMGGLFFSMTVFTTIGYGDNPPKTTAGQAITMVYSFIGIPLLLMVLADMGKIFTRGIKFIFKYIRRLYYLRTFRNVRKVGRSVGNIGRRATLAPIQFTHVMSTNQRNAFIPKSSQVSKEDTNVQNHNNPTKPKTIWYQRKMPFIITTNPTPPGTAMSSPPETPIPEDNIEIDDEFNLPITLAIFILMIYLLLGAIIFWMSEKWTLFHAFYFVFISMSTIGFGDFVPSKLSVMLAAFIYLLFGLALTSMCINVVQEKLSSTFQKAKLTIGETIGLDVNQIMQEELAEEQKSKDQSRDTSAEKSNASKESSVEKADKKTKKTLTFKDQEEKPSNEVKTTRV